MFTRISASSSFRKEHPFISRIAAYGTVGCFIATLGITDGVRRRVEAIQNANPTYPLPTSYCESPPAKIEGIFSEPPRSLLSFAPLGGLGIQGSTNFPVDGVRVRLQRTLTKDTQQELPISIDAKRPVFESDMLPATDQSFNLRLALNETNTEILGITAIVSTTPDDNAKPAGCESPPTILSVRQEADITKMSGNHIRPTFLTVVMGGA